MCQICDDLAVCPRHGNPGWDPWFKDVSELAQEKLDAAMSAPDWQRESVVLK